MLVQIGGASVGRRVASGPCAPRRIIWAKAGKSAAGDAVADLLEAQAVDADEDDAPRRA